MSLVQSAERYIPDLGSNLDYVEFATPLSNEYWVNSVSGGNFGPGHFFCCTAGIIGLFVAGAGAISAGVLSCIASGVRAANQAVEFLEGNIDR
jgi:phytoene dehydrogenase-like protein